jgi:cell division inhibitor SepF
MGLGIMQKISRFFTIEEEIQDEEGEFSADKARWKGKLVHLSSRHNAVVIMEPTTVKEAQEVGDHLKNKATVVLNLQGLERESALRILDFTSGMVYALNGNMHKISESIFVFTPPATVIIPPPKKVGIKETGQLFIK